MKVIFIVGPFRGKNAWDIECNIRRAEELALEVWRAGAAAICPHTNTRFFQDAAPDEVWLKGYHEILRRCDALLLVDGWEMSSGSREEVKLAADMKKIHIFSNIRQLKEWLGSNDL